MSESLLKRRSAYDEAIAEMKATRDRVSAEASWSNPGITTWADLNDAPEMWILKVRSSWAAVGATEESIIAEAKRLWRESKG